MNAVDDLALQPLTEIAALLEEGGVSAEALTSALLARIEAHRDLNAFVRLDAEQAITAAQRADAAPKAHPLSGVPLAHKDMFFRAGRVSTCGSRLFAERPADTTAHVLGRLDALGAVDLGTLHMAEFAHNSTGHNAFLGAARNPWNTEHITGGSSSGPGAAVAAGLAFAALGSDTGGSIRLPAHFCGIVGVKPTQGLVSRAGAMPLSFSLDTVGPMARTVADAALVLQAIAGTDPLDPTTEEADVSGLLAAVGADIAGLRIGIPAAFYDEGLTPDVAQALDAAIRLFERLGVGVLTVHLPAQDGLAAGQLVLVASEAASQHRDLIQDADGYDPQIRNRLLNGFGYSAQDYLAALRGRGPALATHLAATAGVDAILTPVAPFDAPTLAETDVGGSPAAEALIQSISRFMRPANYLGLPAIAFPVALSGRALPIGLQLVGTPFGEATLLALAGAFERAGDFRAHVLPTHHG